MKKYLLAVFVAAFSLPLWAEGDVEERDGSGMSKTVNSCTGKPDGYSYTSKKYGKFVCKNGDAMKMVDLNKNGAGGMGGSGGGDGRGDGSNTGIGGTGGGSKGGAGSVNGGGTGGGGFLTQTTPIATHGPGGGGTRATHEWVVYGSYGWG